MSIEEAIETLGALIPRLKHEYGNDILQFFHPDAVTDSIQVKWDPTKQIATSPDDEAFMQDEEDDEYDFVPIETTESLQQELNKHIHGINQYLQPSSNDSISTFHMPEDQSISSTTIGTNNSVSRPDQASSQVEDNEDLSEDSDDSDDNNSKHSFVSDYSEGNSTLGSLSTKKSIQSAGKSSDSSNESTTSGVSFAATKQVRVYGVEQGTLAKKISKKKSKKELEGMYLNFKDMLEKNSEMNEEQKQAMKKLIASSIKKKRRQRRPSLGKAKA